jgi:hypothetical protein
MNIFATLADELDVAWRETHYDLTAFTAIATKHISNFDYNWSLEKLDSELREWLIHNTSLPPQMSLHNNFGQPSITLFNNNRFVVDLYFWIDFDTSIHSHGFRGAFRLLHGESLQETFQVSAMETIADDIRIVDLKNVNLKILKQNAVEIIAPGFDLTHRVIHLVNPTVTLCVKTINEPHLVQWNYLPSGLAIQRQVMTVEVTKKLYFYQYLLSHNKTEAEVFLHSVLQSLKISTTTLVYETVINNGLDLADKSIEHITRAIVEMWQGSKWWPYYEKAYMAALDEISFKELEQPIERLTAHFENCGYDISKLEKLYDEQNIIPRG